MAKLSGSGAVITLDDSAGSPQTVSSDVKSYVIDYKYPPQSVQGFGEPDNFIPGALVTGVTLNCWYNAAATTGIWTVVKGILNSATTKSLTIKPEAAGLTFSGEFMCDGISLGADATGKPLELGAVHFSPMGTVSPGFA
jgi:hypothetical protein